MGRHSHKLVTCSLPECNRQVKHIKQFSDYAGEMIEHIPTEAYTCIVVLQYVDDNGYQFYQCDAGDLVDGHTWQHWHCSAEHRLTGVKRCIEHHYTEDKLHPIPIGGGTTNLHQQVMFEAHGPGMECAMCGQPITDKAYRIAIMTSTPDWVALGTAHHDELGDWCDTLEHAKALAIKHLEVYHDGISTHKV